MDDRQRVLWNKLEAFNIGNADSEMTFDARLARDNGWTDDFSKHVVFEYKRFIFLMLEAGHPVAPSDEVDQAWHLHLAYTRSYWEELCAKLIGRPLHHGPTEGGEAESKKFTDWYTQTLASYARLFGVTPDPEVWPSPKTRFRRAPHYHRVYLRGIWIGKNRLGPKLAFRCLMLIAFLVSASYIFYLPQRLGLVLKPLPAFLTSIAAFVLFLSSFVGGGRTGSSTGGCGGVGCGGCGGGGCGGCG